MISLLLSLLLFVVKRRCSCGVKQRTVVKVEILRSNERRQGGTSPSGLSSNRTHQCGICDTITAQQPRVRHPTPTPTRQKPLQVNNTVNPPRQTHQGTRGKGIDITHYGATLGLRRVEDGSNVQYINIQSGDAEFRRK